MNDWGWLYGSYSVKIELGRELKVLYYKVGFILCV